MNRQSKKYAIIAPLFLFGIFITGCGPTHRVRIEGTSMEPNLLNGRILSVYPVSIDAIGRGDLISFELDNNRRYVKRVVGLPGETVEIRNGHVVINGAPLEEPYEVVAPKYTMQLVQLEDNEYFVLGDNRPDSYDSHSYGPITYAQIIGRAVP